MDEDVKHEAPKSLRAFGFVTLLLLVPLLLATLSMGIGWTRTLTGNQTPVIAGTTQRADVAFSEFCNRGIIEIAADGSDLPCDASVVATWPQTRVGDVEVLVGLERFAERAIFVGGQMLLVAMAWVVLFSASAFAGSVSKGRVFEAANATRLALIGWLLAAFPLVRAATGFALNSVMSEESVGVRGFAIDFTPKMTLYMVLSGLLLVGVGWTYRWGVELQKFEKAVI